MRERKRGWTGWKAAVIATAFAWLAVMPAAQASPACINNATLAYYQSLTNGCTVGNVLFNFSSQQYTYTPASEQETTPVDTVPAASDVELTIVGDGSPDSQVGFTFTPINGTYWGAYDTDGTQTADINLTFEATLEGQPSSPGFDTTTLTLNVNLLATSPDSGAGAYETVTAGPLSPYSGTPEGTIQFLFPNNGTDETNSGTTSLAPLTQDLTVNKDLFMEGAAEGDYSQINSFTETFTYTPEPGAILLVGIGLLALAGIRWRRRLALPLAGLAILALGVPGAHASTCGTTTLQAYITQSQSPQGGCTIGDVLFQVTSYTPSGGAPAADDVTVIPVTNSLDPGLDIEPIMQNDTTTPMSITLVIVAQASTNPIDDVTSMITGGVSCVGTDCASLSGGVTTNVGGIDIPYALTPTNPPGGYSAVGGTETTTPNPLPLTTSITITDTLTLTGGGTFFTGAHASNIELQVSQTPGIFTSVPEPWSFLAIGGGLIAIASGSRRVRRAARRGRQPS